MKNNNKQNYLLINYDEKNYLEIGNINLLIFNTDLNYNYSKALTCAKFIFIIQMNINSKIIIINEEKKLK